MRVLELYCGIGGCAAALGALGEDTPATGLSVTGALGTGLPRARAQVVAALDVNRVALDVYRHNFRHPVEARSLESLSVEQLAAFDADLWWASPPCQPFTRRGRRLGLEDPRAATLIALLDRLAAVKPLFFAMENVEGFNNSDAHRLLLSTLEQAGYQDFRECLLCPSELGFPNRRPRYYAVAARRPLLPESPPTVLRRSLAEILVDLPRRANQTEALGLDSQHLKKYRGALHLVRLEDSTAVTQCFTSAYGRSHVRSGSFLLTGDDPAARRFSPQEILRLLGFPSGFSLPPELPLSNAFRLVGNSLSLGPVRQVLASVPGLFPNPAGRASGLEI